MARASSMVAMRPMRTPQRGQVEHVEVEGAPHQVRPRPVAGFARHLALELRDAGRSGVNRGFLQRDPRPLVDDARPHQRAWGARTPWYGYAQRRRSLEREGGCVGHPGRR